jgi:hypothetical protein
MLQELCWSQQDCPDWQSHPSLCRGPLSLPKERYKPQISHSAAISRPEAGLTWVLHISAWSSAPTHARPPKAGLEMPMRGGVRSDPCPTEWGMAPSLMGYDTPSIGYLGLLHRRLLVTTPPPQEREQGLWGPQLDQCPCTAATGLSSARERQ